MKKRWLIKIKEVVITPVVFISSLVLFFLKYGPKKVSGRDPYICDPVHEPPIICDPVHEPPVLAAKEYFSQKPILFLSLLVLIIYPINLYRTIKSYFVTQFTVGQLFKNLILRCFLWVLAYSLLFTLGFVALVLMGFFYYQPNSLTINTVVAITLSFSLFLPSLMFLTGAELILVAAKDRRFAVTGVIFVWLAIVSLLISLSLVNQVNNLSGVPIF